MIGPIGGATYYLSGPRYDRVVTGPDAAETDDAVLDAATGLVRMSFLVQSRYATTATAHDLTPQQAQLLCIVKDQPRPMAELVQILHMDKSSVSGLVDRVVQRGFLRRRPSPTDRRAVVVEATAKGRRRGDAFFEAMAREMNDVVDQLDPPDRVRLAELLSDIVRAESVPAVFGEVAG